MGSKFELSIKTNVDHYANVCREFRLERTCPLNSREEHLILHSGTNGVTLRVQGSNNGYIYLNEAEVKSLIKELTNSISFSKEAKDDMAAYWSAKNSALPGLKKKYE